MSTFRLRGGALSHALLVLACAPTVRALAAPADASIESIEISTTRLRLDAARNGLSPDTGSTVYRIDAEDIDRLPLGGATPLNQVLLQAPGVVQDAFGQLHVRGDHANLQYRIDGIAIPEAISGFGQSLETRLADHIQVLTGALPAQYGNRTAGVVDIRTRRPEGGTAHGEASLTAGSHGHAEIGLDLAGSAGRFGYVVSGSVLRDALGIENPTPERSALHDTTRQHKGFAALSWVLDPDSRVTTLLGSTDNRFEIPNVPGLAGEFALAGTPAPDSATLDARQRERNRFATLAWQQRLDTATDLQLALVHRTTDVHYRPDVTGDLVFHGIAADVLRRNTADGLQADLSHAIGPDHTLRAGLAAQRERYSVANHALVFPADDDGNPSSDQPFAIDDATAGRGRQWSAYLQDEWRPAPRWTVNTGLRYDNVRTVVAERQWSPRLGLVFEASDTLRLHAGAARYFTPPPTEKIDTTSVAKFAGTTNALPSDADTAVRSERSTYLDAGIAWQATPRLTLGLDAYERHVRHLQDEGQFGNALIYSAFNFAEGCIRGVEATASFKDGALSAYANVAWSHAVGKGIETGQFNFDADELAAIASQWVHLDHDQQLTASAGASWRTASGLQWSGDMLFGSGLRNGFANGTHLPAYAQFNAAVAQDVELGAGLGRIGLRLAVLNLFDRSAALRDGSGIGVGAPQYLARRSVLVTASKAF